MTPHLWGDLISKGRTRWCCYCDRSKANARVVRPQLRLICSRHRKRKGSKRWLREKEINLLIILNLYKCEWICYSLLHTDSSLSFTHMYMHNTHTYTTHKCTHTQDNTHIHTCYIHAHTNTHKCHIHTHSCYIHANAHKHTYTNAHTFINSHTQRHKGDIIPTFFSSFPVKHYHNKMTPIDKSFCFTYLHLLFVQARWHKDFVFHH